LIKAIDLGFGQVKAMDDSSMVEYPAAVGSFRPVRFTSGMEGQELKDKLCLEYKNKRYYIGDIAFTQSAPRVTMNSDRFTSQEGLALMMSALVLIAKCQTEEVRIVAGLPVNEYAGLKDNYSDTLKDKHYAQLISPDGKEGEFYRFDVDDVMILPQPIGTIFDKVLDNTGELADKALAGGRVAVLDIGKHTVDLALTDALQFVDRSSISFNDVGLFDAFKDLSLALKEEGYDIPADSLEPYVRGSRKLDCLPVLKEQSFATQADKVISRVLNTWPDLWTFDKIYITGGGAITLGDYIASGLNSDKVEVCSNPTFTNCRGYHKFACRKWK